MIRIIITLLVLNMVLVGLDAYTTVTLLGMGYEEGNPNALAIMELYGTTGWVLFLMGINTLYSTIVVVLYHFLSKRIEFIWIIFITLGIIALWFNLPPVMNNLTIL